MHPDVNADGTQWYSAGRTWAMNNQISDGTNMDGTITREQMATILYRYAKIINKDTARATALDVYVDGKDVSEYAVEAMKWSVATGLFSGKGNQILDPKGNAPRAEVATLLGRFEALK